MPQWLTIRADAPRVGGGVWMGVNGARRRHGSCAVGGHEDVDRGCWAPVALASLGDLASLGTMHLDVYRVAKEIAVRVGKMGVKEAELRSQATRAAQSLLLNLSEGLPSRSEPMRRRYFTTARGSAYEVAAAVDIAAALGDCAEEEAAAVLTLCDRVSAMLFRMR